MENILSCPICGTTFKIFASLRDKAACPKCGYRWDRPYGGPAPPPPPPPSRGISSSSPYTQSPYAAPPPPPYRSAASPSPYMQSPYAAPPPYARPPAAGYGGHFPARQPQVVPPDKMPRPAYPGTARQPFGANRCQVCSSDNMGKPLRRYHDGYLCSSCRRSISLRRMGAFLLDYLVMSSIATVAWIIFALIIFLVSPSFEITQVLFVLFNLGSSSPYLIGKDAWFKGRSVGKAACGITVVDVETNYPIGPGQSVKRNAILLVPLIWLFVFLQLIFWRGRRLGEKWAGTRVVFTQLPAFARYNLYNYAHILWLQQQSGVLQPSSPPGEDNTFG